MEEQVVPGARAKPPVRRAPVLRSKKVSVDVPRVADRSVPALRPAKRAKTAASTSFLSPAAEYTGKARWATPLRVGKWLENWQSARELGLHVAVRSPERIGVADAVKTAIAEAVVANVGNILPVPTVLKWLCLLFEYLELNADEQVLVVCLLRKYVECGGKFVGQGDWARPQRWECVVAIACYFAVLLTEEFPGRTSMDLRELLGPNFRFGKEQIAFLRIVDWRISIQDTTFREVKERCINVANNVAGEKERLMEWFRLDIAVAEREKRVANVTAACSPTVVPVATPSNSTTSAALNVKTAVAYYAAAAAAPPNLKKRSYAAIAPADDSIVPFVPQFAAIAPVIPAVRQWMPHGW